MSGSGSGSGSGSRSNALRKALGNLRKQGLLKNRSVAGKYFNSFPVNGNVIIPAGPNRPAYSATLAAQAANQAALPMYNNMFPENAGIQLPALAAANNAANNNNGSVGGDIIVPGNVGGNVLWSGNNRNYPLNISGVSLGPLRRRNTRKSKRSMSRKNRR
jgi:hypothetical protein